MSDPKYQHQHIIYLQSSSTNLKEYPPGIYPIQYNRQHKYQQHIFSSTVIVDTAVLYRNPTKENEAQVEAASSLEALVCMRCDNISLLFFCCLR